jgi:RNA-binding protein Nova
MSGLLDNEVEVNAQIEAVLSDDQDGEYERHPQPDRSTILKMLVTDNIAGAIIGKNGKAIADIQEECGARIKVSQTADFYPGTSERTILITGINSNESSSTHLIVLFRIWK